MFQSGSTAKHIAWAMIVILGVSVFALRYVRAAEVDRAFKTNNFGLNQVVGGDLKNLLVGVDPTKPAGNKNTLLPLLIGSGVSSALTLIGVLFFVLMLYGGILWMTARGNDDQIRKAVQVIYAAVIGIIIIFGARALTYYVMQSTQKDVCGLSSHAECVNRPVGSACGAAGNQCLLAENRPNSECNCVTAADITEPGNAPNSNGICVDNSDCVGRERLTCIGSTLPGRAGLCVYENNACRSSVVDCTRLLSQSACTNYAQFCFWQGISSAGTCINDSDCGTNGVCFYGSCQNGSPSVSPGGPCNSDFQCTSQEFCQNGVCVLNPDFANNPSTRVVECAGPDDCSPGMLCVNNRCIQ